jgi:PleD family two-component response regulator
MNSRLAVAVAVADNAALQRPKVLLVDDDEVNLLLTSIALSERGFAITEASGGQQALELLANSVPDVVLLDALMPELDGFETCRRLRAIPGAASIPVLMLTGLDDDASISRAYEAGATDFFVKSPQWTLLAGRLGYLLRSSRARRTWRGWAAWTGASARARPSSRWRAFACSAAEPARTRTSAPCCA